MPQVNVPTKQHINFNATGNPSNIQVQRYQPFGAATFAVYDTNTKQAYGAGSCPALSAHPPYISVPIPANAPYTVQSLDGELTVVY